MGQYTGSGKTSLTNGDITPVDTLLTWFSLDTHDALRRSVDDSTKGGRGWGKSCDFVFNSTAEAIQPNQPNGEWDDTWQVKAAREKHDFPPQHNEWPW